MAPRDKAFERDELLSLVSHEMKNPLTSITGYTMFAEDAVKNHDHELALESLQVVRAETQRVLRLAEDLLDSAQVNRRPLLRGHRTGDRRRCRQRISAPDR
ncbi:MAG: hypothetical protein DMF58_15885 [Acidobacteria bacterium]|nr:MAG: hypothetical protein DMF58_15885 [Acidobacteriota bacterium]